MVGLAVSSYQIRSSNVLTIKKFGNKYKITWNKSIRNKGFENLIDLQPEMIITPFGTLAEVVPEFAGDRANGLLEGVKMDNNISRAKSKIFEYAFCNEWDFFVTLTIDKDKYDRYDLNKFVKDLGQWIQNYYKIYGSKIWYLFIPEPHKDGAWHLHGLIRGVRPDHIVRNNYGYLDFPLYQKKFGFISMDYIRDHDAVSKYITKYITKELMCREFGQRTYYCSKGLQTAEVLYRIYDVDPDGFEWDFEHTDGFCRTSLVDNLDAFKELIG